MRINLDFIRNKYELLPEDLENLLIDDRED